MSNTMLDDFPQTAPQSQQGSRGCLMGCLIAVGIMVALAICGGVGTYWFLTGQVQKYTAEAPLDLPAVQYEPEKMAELEARLKSFESAVDTGEGEVRELELSADDINAMIAKEPSLNGKALIKIEEGKIVGDVSFPTDKIPGGQGRFFNGSVTLDASMEGGVLIVTLVDAEIDGEKLPQKFVDALANENLAKDLYKNPENAKTMRQFEEIRIEEDKVILKLKPIEPVDPNETASFEETDTTEADPAEADPAESAE